MTPTQIPFIEGIPTSLQTYPVFFFVQDVFIMMQVGDKAPVQLGDASDLGEIKAAFLVGNAVYLVRNQSIQRVRLSDGKSDVILRFDHQVTGEKLFLTQDRSRILYAVIVNDIGAPFAQAIRAGFIDLATGSVRPFLSEPQNMFSLGLSAKSQEFYGMAMGDDTDFGPLWVFDTQDGSVTKELPVNASGSASLTPDKRYVVTKFLWVKDKFGLDAENVIRLYGLSSDSIAPVDFLIPPQPSTVSHFLWSPDSQNVYFQPFDINTGQPFGLWRLDVPTGAIDPVASISDSMLGMMSVSPDGKWMVLGYANDLSMLAKNRAPLIKKEEEVGKDKLAIMVRDMLDFLRATNI